MKTLFWSEQGMINCKEHAPYKGSDTWLYGHWEIIDPLVVKSEKLQCEICKEKS